MHSVEGAELTTIESLRFDRLSIGVLLVEVRADGQRRPILTHLLRSGFHYAGQVDTRPSRSNAVIEDVFVNVTHLRRFWPRSRGAA